MTGRYWLYIQTDTKGLNVNKREKKIDDKMNKTVQRRKYTEITTVSKQCCLKQNGSYKLIEFRNISSHSGKRGTHTHLLDHQKPHVPQKT